MAYELSKDLSLTQEQKEDLIKISFYYDDEKCGGKVSKIYRFAPPELKTNLSLDIWKQFYSKYISGNANVINFIKSDKRTYDYDNIYFYNTLANKLELFGLNVAEQSVRNQKGINLSDVKNKAVDPNTTKFILTNKQHLNTIDSLWKEATEVASSIYAVDYPLATKKNNIKCKIPIDEYASLIKIFNNTLADYNQKYIEWWRDEEGYSYFKMGDNDFKIQTLSQKNMIPRSEVVKKNGKLIGYLPTVRVNGTLFFWNDKKDFLYKYYRFIANNIHKKQIIPNLNFLDQLDIVVREVNAQKARCIRAINKIDNKGIGETEQLEIKKRNELENIVVGIEASIEDLDKQIANIQRDLIKLQQRRDNALLTIGKQKELLISFSDPNDIVDEPTQDKKEVKKKLSGLISEFKASI